MYFQKRRYEEWKCILLKGKRVICPGIDFVNGERIGTTMATKSSRRFVKEEH